MGWVDGGVMTEGMSGGNGRSGGDSQAVRSVESQDHSRRNPQALPAARVRKQDLDVPYRSKIPTKLNHQATQC